MDGYGLLNVVFLQEHRWKSSLYMQVLYIAIKIYILDWLIVFSNKS